MYTAMSAASAQPARAKISTRVLAPPNPESGVGVGSGVAAGVAVGSGVAVGVTVGSGVAVGVTVGVAVGVGAGVGVGVGVACMAWYGLENVGGPDGSLDDEPDGVLVGVFECDGISGELGGAGGGAATATVLIIETSRATAIVSDTIFVIAFRSIFFRSFYWMYTQYPLPVFRVASVFGS